MDEQNPQFNEPIQNSKNIWMIVSSVIITALVIGGGVYMWQKSNLKSTEQSLQQKISELQSQVNRLQEKQTQESVETKEDETADWKTYRNEEYGFEFKYPDQLILNNNKAVEEVSLYENKRTYENLIVGIGKRIFVDEDYNPIKNTGYADHLKCLSGGIVEQIQIGGLKGSKYSLKYGYTEGKCEDVQKDHPGNTPYVNIMVCRGENKTIEYNIHYFFSREDIAEQILSTFKFTK